MNAAQTGHTQVKVSRLISYLCNILAQNQDVIKENNGASVNVSQKLHP